MGFVFHHLRRGAGRNQRVETRNGTACNGDKQEGEQAAGEYRAGAVDEFGDRRHLQGRVHYHDTDGQRYDGTDFQESGEVIARGEQQPHRQYGGHKAVNHDRPSQLNTIQIKQMAKRTVRHIFTVYNRQHQQNHTDN